MFKQVDPRQNFPKLEEDILAFWKENNTFDKVQENRKKAKRFNFYDGPPFANGLPHYGHILAMMIKDTIVRYKTMQGYYVPRRFGWDTHGLPVEYEVEKELKLSGKKDIENYGIEKFNNYCQSTVLRYADEWKKTIERIGRWGDLNDFYVTMDNEYIQSIWWVFKSIYDKGLVYEGFKSMPYCPRCGTPLSNFETNQGYQENTPDPSIFIKFKLKSAISSQPSAVSSLDSLENQFSKADSGKLITESYLLVWTTTPWTLPANAALAIGENIDYVKIKLGDEYLILAESRLSVIDGDYKIIENFKGKKLLDLEYEPLYKFLPIDKKAHYVVAADFVSTEDGTGIVHIAPAFGEDDLALGQKLDLPIIQTVDKNGLIIPEVKPWAGMFVKKADKEIIADLEKRGLLYKQGIVKHTYPFCWRCDTPLIYYAISTWFVKVSQLRSELVKNNEKIHWTPGHIKEGRFGKWIADARDWAITRNRYWGAPVPIWRCECGEIKVIGSIDELEKLGGKKLDNLHRPYIDEVTLVCEKCGKPMRRIEEVFDCWFESGSMPYAQFNYPFKDADDFKNKFPADFIAEGLDQTRGWFYTLHVIASILFDSPAYLNVIVNGIILAKDGKKLSKRLRNYPEPKEIFDNQGADALRWFLLSSPAAAGEDVRFSSENVSDTVRRNILLIWNMYLFFTNYANLDNWDKNKISTKQSAHILDQWVLARLDETINLSTKAFDDYNLPRAIRPVEDFVNDLSTWYLRRSRKRRDDGFYSTMYQVLVNLVKIIAPFSPYIAENIYQNLRAENDPQSVHLCDWPKISSQLSANSSQLLLNMKLAREIVEKTHALRAESGIKLRQPLNKLKIQNSKFKIKELLDIIADEVNVKKVEIDVNQKEELVLDTEITPELKKEGLAREIVRQIQSLRKKSGLKPQDKIKIFININNELGKDVLAEFGNSIAKQVIGEIVDKKIEDSLAEFSKEDLYINIAK